MKSWCRPHRFICAAVSVTLLLSLMLSLFSCGAREQYCRHCELGIILPVEYDRVETEESFDLAYFNGSILIGITRLSFAVAMEMGIPATLTPLRFAEVHRSITGKEDASAVEEWGDVPVYSYSAGNSEGTEYSYLTAFYVSYYAYFIVTFIATASVMEEQEGEIARLAATVYLSYDGVTEE